MVKTEFSANLGFLWADLPLDLAIRKAWAAGFAAVECHWPYSQDKAAVIEALDETGLPLISLNTARGDAEVGEFGLAALPGRQAEARQTIDEALAWADELNAAGIHLMAGVATGDKARETFLENINYACQQARDSDVQILIEPINTHDVPGYFLQTCDQAAGIITALSDPRLKLMFDCYHVARMGDNLIESLDRHIGIIGHVQFAGIPHRGHPGESEIALRPVFQHLLNRGYRGPLGAEYQVAGETGETLSWMRLLA